MKLPPKTALAVVRQSYGALYDTLRNQLLDDVDAYAVLLETDGEQPDWRRRTQALILSSWRDHGAAYREVMDAIDGIDVDRVSGQTGGLGTAVARALDPLLTRHGPPLVPLGWERIWKQGTSLPPWQVQAYLLLLRHLPDPRSKDVLLWAAEHIEDRGVPYGCMEALVRLPPDPGLVAALASGVDRHQRLAGVFQRAAQSLSES